MPAVELLGVSKTFPGGVVGLAPTTLALEPGEHLALLGPSGSGKSTLLRLVAGLEVPDAGEVRFAGRPADPRPHRRGVAMLAQRPALYPHRTVERNVGNRDAAERLNLGHLLARLPHELSGGERQRVALAKLLARNAPVWLLDEPFAGLDPMFRNEFRRDLHLLLANTGATMVLVTHDPTDALALGRRVGVLGNGHLQQLGTPEELQTRPGTRFVAFCLGRLGLVDGRAGGGDRSERTFVSECGSVTVPLPADVVRRIGPDPTPSLTLGIRPEDVVPVPPGERPNPSGGHGILSGWPVVSAEPVGSGWLLTLARGRTPVRAWQPSGPPPRVGLPADWFLLNADRAAWFDRDGKRLGD